MKRNSPDPRCPMQPTNWYDAVLYCNWLSRQENLTCCYRMKRDNGEWELDPEANGYRLPTEAEWEYACRAGSTTEYSCGKEPTYLPSYAVYNSTDTMTKPCAGRLPNAWGLFDMHGNAHEWCRSRIGTTIRGQVDPRFKCGRVPGRYGAGRSPKSTTTSGRSARRERAEAKNDASGYGFRVARRCK